MDRIGVGVEASDEGSQKVNDVNYLTRNPPPLVDEFCYDEDDYLVNDQTGGFEPTFKVLT